ncbi:inositol monophosphatase family protein [Bifidobacterium gallicum]|uniref:Inositol monophosphatase n=1 Tax=Bifidobacterium gallicum DSM 20093 = LMG 11596 TaxID=561180 RepID=D1NU94_9BIFI|nr:inositol monophosphatase family protein [Bifidobacterium gallicum]EFA23298.1 inositol monophosphatase family protein [Bifidobacterium gallicum DSM 20093 = LMG 11596]KFI58940.1 inositol monophosphatase [Bifidobacterium gallicum DSM 20093 = LMG 11596]
MTELRNLAMQAAQVAQDAGRHALADQVTPRSLMVVDPDHHDYDEGLEVEQRLERYMAVRLNEINPFSGLWNERPAELHPGDRFWCPGGIDGVINYSRSMAEWTVTISLFEFNEHLSAQPIIGVVHAPALNLTYVAARRSGAIRIRKTPMGEKREKTVPSTTAHLDGSVVSFGMSHKSEESKRALDVVAALSGRPADIKRIGPASLDLCKVADGTYDAYFEPNLHEWDVPAVSAGAIVIWESQGRIANWAGDLIHWRSENDVVATNGIINDELRPILLEH